ncbi:MAG: 3-dehydroquinate synthase, partial [Candidatus Gracilibacteria bacterium]|nr:3-dehydroquinate synthase [Candidatus Gracilibacteria bacterium]
KILFTPEVLREIEKFVQENGVKKALFLTENTVWKFHGKELFEHLKDAENVQYYKYVFRAGEKNKNINTVLSAVDYLNTIKFNRNDLIICFGGGVVGDLGGFLASMYKRGVNFIQIPTTLLSILDSSVGGKTGVDYAGIKNIIGAFNQPKVVLVNKDYLQTLPELQVVSGYFEGLKHALLDSEKHFDSFCTLFNSMISFKEVPDEVLFSNIRIKADIVMRDEEEKGERKKLNYGHTFGHAIESLNNYKLPHGVCVGYGIIFANIVSHNLGYLDESLMNRINTFIIKIVRKYTLKDSRFDEINKMMLNDKKNNTQKVKFTLLQNIGNIHFIEVDRKDLEKAYNELLYFIS